MKVDKEQKRLKAIKLKCITELSARLMQKHSRNEIIFQSPKSVSDYYMESLRHLEQEHVIVLLLDGKNRLLGEKTISVGTVNSAPVSTREILKKRLRHPTRTHSLPDIKRQSFPKQKKRLKK